MPPEYFAKSSRRLAFSRPDIYQGFAITPLGLFTDNAQEYLTPYRARVA